MKISTHNYTGIPTRFTIRMPQMLCLTVDNEEPKFIRQGLQQLIVHVQRMMTKIK